MSQTHDHGHWNMYFRNCGSPSWPRRPGHWPQCSTSTSLRQRYTEDRRVFRRACMQQRSGIGVIDIALLEPNRMLCLPSEEHACISRRNADGKSPYGSAGRQTSRRYRGYRPFLTSAFGACEMVARYFTSQIFTMISKYTSTNDQGLVTLFEFFLQHYC